MVYLANSEDPDTLPTALRGPAQFICKLIRKLKPTKKLCYKFVKNDTEKSDIDLDLVNINAFIKFGQILSICSKDIKRKRNSDMN